MAILKKIGKVFMWFFIVIFAAFAILVIVRMFHFYNLKKTVAEVAKIHATKLTMDDVMGKNLPPDPGAEADKTIAGIDANKNGIRDDVELAIFKKYPNSAKTRAALLQYALALQMEVVQPIVNKETVTEVVREQSRADSCVSDSLVPRKNPESSRSYIDVEKIDTFINFVKERQLNTDLRKQARKDFVEKIGSYAESENKVCDIDLSVLSN
ncbi:MAG: hypothetical protein KGJ58_02980 [Patescibacteria group bacterium]|nr:hypothetical protein [Patescibacteria group bacterium]MDE1988355.1 hypothetical protein [Patescibacteria group bacterium]MDE2218389.1 hypothetical protein [Patescibacteria group bacterium]